MDLPVYLFTGFLDSGKTTFVQTTLEDKRFNAGERTLVLLCEEGEVELDPTRFSGKNVTVQVVEDSKDLTTENMTAWQKACRAQRVMVEYNGMWMLDDLYMNMPKNWVIYQEMMFADANSFVAYNANMRTFVYDKLRSAQLVVFNRAQKGLDKMALHQIVRGVSRQTDIAYEYGEDDVEYDDIEDPLPFDKEAPVVEIKENDYALWYRDLTEDLQSYDGKTVRFLGQVVRDHTIPKTCFVVGRPLMTCCEADIRFAGLACNWDDAKSLKNRDWVTVQAKIAVEKHPCYDRVGPVLNVTSVEPAKEPENQVATFF